MAALTWRLPPQAAVFVDTSAMFGLTVDSDQSNADAIVLSRQLKEVRARLITSNFVVAEYHALLVNRVSSRFANIALSAVDRGETRVVLISPADEARAREILARYDDHGYTLTDATSFALMERLGITIAFTFDHHFAMQGYEIPTVNHDSQRARVTTVEQASVRALALPGAEQKSHFGNVDFRVRNKVFASFPYPDQMTLRLDPEHARILTESDPETYIPHPGVWGQRGWIRVTLSRITPDDLADLVHESWFRLAPKQLQSDSSS